MSAKSDRPAGAARSGWLWTIPIVVAVGLAGVAYFAWPTTTPSEPPQVPPEQAGPAIPPDPDRDEGTLPVGLQPEWNTIDDPSRDGWDTEVFAERAKHQLEKIGALLIQQPVSADGLAPFVSDNFSCQPLVPAKCTTQFQDAVVLVERSDGEPQSNAVAGAEGFAKLLNDVRGQYQLPEDGGHKSDLHIKFKIFRVAAEPQSITTRQYVSISGPTESGSREEHATWTIRWKSSTDDAAPVMERIDIEQYQRTSLLRPQPLLADCTESILKSNECYREQFLRGMNHWLQRTRPVSFAGNPGLAVADVNGDGLEDLFVCQEAGLPNRLFIQQPDGTAVDKSTDWGVDWLDSARSALLIDLDNDGDQDLMVGSDGNLIVAENQDGKRFVVRDVLPTGGYVMSICAADFDLDGDLDVYVCNLQANDELEESRAVLAASASSDLYHDARNGGRNVMLRNDLAADNWQFTDVTAQLGLDADNRRVTYAASWEDFDNDGDPDLYVANDYGPNHLLRNDVNQNGGFVDVAAKSNAQDQASGMSVSWGDFDRDGRMDLYVANMFSAAGGRITRQSQFKSDAAGVKKTLQRFARGNTLLRSTDSGRFEDLSEAANVHVGRWAWSSNFCDLNNDGWEDLLVANGFITTEDNGDL